MKIYVVECGEYSDRRIVGAFTSREKAVAYIESVIKEYMRQEYMYIDAYSIYEVEVDEPKATFDNDMFEVFLIDGVWSASKTDYIGHGELERMRLRAFSLANMSGVFFAKDKDHAIKMAQDAYAKMKAEELGL